MSIKISLGKIFVGLVIVLQEGMVQMVLLGKVCCLKLESSVLHLHVIYVWVVSFKFIKRKRNKLKNKNLCGIREGGGLEGGVGVVVVIYKSDSYMTGVSVVIGGRVIYKSYSYMIIYSRGVSVVVGGRVI
ncbi:hypothetical protein CWI36_0737p0020 [Hamiltosporidium magnivora]|uniref:Uncharacterized protein n=1 Tax=Hamiltosporidium magnivora TaxID=148818 RepID=A0A4V2JVM1_9MICR|nr:hypothetical protein CWI36_0737p0020 [Hamiltosporidium magnivora]